MQAALFPDLSRMLSRADEPDYVSIKVAFDEAEVVIGFLSRKLEDPRLSSALAAVIEAEKAWEEAAK